MLRYLLWIFLLHIIIDQAWNLWTFRNTSLSTLILVHYWLPLEIFFTNLIKISCISWVQLYICACTKEMQYKLSTIELFIECIVLFSVWRANSKRLCQDSGNRGDRLPGQCCILCVTRWLYDLRSSTVVYGK